MNKTYDVVIIGAGTAGLMLARELGKYKCKTLLLDRRKDLLNFSFKTLASFMNLKDFDLSENIVAQKINTTVVHSKRIKSEIKEDLCILDKEILHKELLASLDSNYIDVKTGVHVNDIFKENSEDTYTHISDKKGEIYKGKIFVDASGTVGVISKKVGLLDSTNTVATGVEYNVKYHGNSNEMHLMIGKTYEGGYGWIFPLKNERAIIGFGTLEETLFKGLKSRLNKIIELPKFKKLVTKDNDLVEGGSIPITPVIEKFTLNNLICVGDSVSQVNPIVGEGYKFIFEAAIMASKHIKNAIENNDTNLLIGFEEDWKKRFLSNYKRSKIAQNRIFSSFSKKDISTDIGMILLKLRSNKKNVETLSGEYN
tara:strand:+ start:7677 stop:8780 length:1104 start_codon:yes stop_codon:yes gene_type:complete